MPFIDSKITVALSESKKELLKTRLGQAISLLHKPESYLMVGFSDNYDLFMGGKKLEKGAFVSVRLLGDARREDCAKMTKAIAAILEEELGIPGDNIYTAYQGIANWGMGENLF